MGGKHPNIDVSRKLIFLCIPNPESNSLGQKNDRKLHQSQTRLFSSKRDQFPLGVECLTNKYVYKIGMQVAQSLVKRTSETVSLVLAKLFHLTRHPRSPKAPLYHFTSCKARGLTFTKRVWDQLGASQEIKAQKKHPVSFSIAVMRSCIRKENSLACETPVLIF